MTQGCGASNMDVICQEFDSQNFLCICPGEDSTQVHVNSTFPGCANAGNPPTSDEILASVNTTHLEAFLVNGVEQVLGAAVVTINGNSFTLNVNATVPIDGLTAELQSEIAAWLGGDYTASDITAQFTNKKRDASNGQLTVVVDSHSSSVSSHALPAYLVLGLFTILTVLF